MIAMQTIHNTISTIPSEEQANKISTPISKPEKMAELIAQAGVLPVALAADIISALRSPDLKNRATAIGIVNTLETKAIDKDMGKQLNQLMDDSGVGKKFDVSKLSLSEKSALYLMMIDLMSSFKEAYVKTQAQETILKGKMAQAKSDSINSSAQTAVSTAVTQAVVGVSVAGVGAQQQFKGNYKQRQAVNNEGVTAKQLEQSLNNAQLNLRKGGAPAQEAAAPAKSPRLETEDGGVIGLEKNSGQLRDDHKARIEQDTQSPIKQELDDVKTAYENRTLSAEKNRILGGTISQLPLQLTGVIGAHGQMMQAGEQSAQNMLDHSNQVTDTAINSSNNNANESASMKDMLLQMLKDAANSQLKAGVSAA